MIFKLKMKNIWYKIITHLVQITIRLKTTEYKEILTEERSINLNNYKGENILLIFNY